MKRLIVNADDFGLSRGVNAGVVEAHERGIVTSTTLMVCAPAAAEAARWAREHPRLGLGLHVDLWESVLDDGRWVRLYERCAGDAASISAAIEHQLGRFRDLVGRDPDHLDSHQHVHRQEPAGSVVRAFAVERGLPLRGHGGFRYVGGFYGQDAVGGPYLEGITAERLVELIDALPPAVTELSCHPGRIDPADALGGTMYRRERNDELRALCDPRVRERVARGDVRLGSYADFAATARVEVEKVG